MEEETWTPMKYQYCFVSTCLNSATKTTKKMFFSVPYNNRKAWCRAGGRSDVITSTLYICEDHLLLEEDIENYLQWKYGKFRPKLKTKVPSKLLALKLYQTEQASNLEYCASAATEQPTCSFSKFKEDKEIQCVPDMRNASIQATVSMVDHATNTIPKKNILTMHSHTEYISTEEEILPSTQGSTVELSEYESNTDSTLIENEIIPTSHSANFISIIDKKPYQYLGIPKSFFWLVDFTCKDTKVPKVHIITVLYKLKHGDPFYKITDLFKISETTLSRIFPRTLDMLATICTQFIYWPSAIHIKQNLPLSFRTKAEYANTQSIVDCFEIEIEKPTNPIQQSSTWSQYKNCNTVKFLISSTPDGFINFISKGYGGRISDMKLVEMSGFIDVVKPNSTVIADRGFKHLDSVLQKKSVKLLRPPSVFSNVKMTKSEAIEAKVIASLRIHIERVIRRVRLFKFLKPHSTINNKLVNCIDNAVVVACGLINLQCPIIKKQ